MTTSKATSILSAAMISSLSAAVIHTEVINGDLGSPDSPTDLGTLLLGQSTINGTLQNPTNFDPDAFTFTVAVGQELTSVVFDIMDGSGHFFAFNSGALSTFNSPPNLIATLLGSANVGTDVLSIPSLEQDFGGTGTTGTLGAGNYSLWFQETNGSQVNYSITITTTPEPSTGLLLMLSSLSLGIRRRR